jgi:hypothetical protein
MKARGTILDATVLAFSNPRPTMGAGIAPWTYAVTRAAHQAGRNEARHQSEAGHKDRRPVHVVKATVKKARFPAKWRNVQPFRDQRPQMSGAQTSSPR